MSSPNRHNSLLRSEDDMVCQSPLSKAARQDFTALSTSLALPGMSEINAADEK